MHQPLDGKFYQATEDLEWNKNEKVMVNMETIMKRYNFVFGK